MSTSYNPLRDQVAQAQVIPGPLSVEMRLASEYLDRAADANIHDRDAMLRAATGLEYRLRALLAALGAEGVQA
ncbi:hypothetical protein [Streptomyces turgidiscabies]|uniref:hypothetical protein n=1 Tax=Streptomyces turgidiscabies TaxID=85558 RepID=UPI0038F7193B